MKQYIKFAAFIMGVGCLIGVFTMGSWITTGRYTFVGFGSAIMLVQGLWAIFCFSIAFGKSKPNSQNGSYLNGQQPPVQSGNPSLHTNQFANGTANKFCPYCGEPMQEDYLFCPQCGKGNPST